MQEAVARTIDEEYIAGRPTSQRLYQEATTIFPSGVTHDTRYFRPFPIYIAHAAGARKWDVDGNEYIDYRLGHGALMLGHGHPAIVRAVQEQVARGTHYGASHELELRWGRLVQQLVPCADMVKFTSSGTEATMMAIRLARVATGRMKIAKFAGHFHGWHDHLNRGISPPYDLPGSAGVPDVLQELLLVLPPNDVDAARAALATREVAAVILEPSGGHGGVIPTAPGFLEALRQITRETGTVLIFDEVVTGFRLAPGGAQALYGVTPDLATFAKALVGGLPGGAVAGRRELFEPLAFGPDAERNRRERVAHPGTFNANPLSAAAGVAALESYKDGHIHRHTDRLSELLRDALQERLDRRGIAGVVWGGHAILHIGLGLTASRAEIEAGHVPPEVLEHSVGGPRAAHLRRAGYVHGIDLPAPNTMLSVAHTEADIETTVRAFDTSLARLQREGAL
jgi:glutamate-1-semialdehyde 2,1-aminomutase